MWYFSNRFSRSSDLANSTLCFLLLATLINFSACNTTSTSSATSSSSSSASTTSSSSSSTSSSTSSSSSSSGGEEEPEYDDCEAVNHFPSQCADCIQSNQDKCGEHSCETFLEEACGNLTGSALTECRRIRRRDECPTLFRLDCEEQYNADYFKCTGQPPIHYG